MQIRNGKRERTLNREGLKSGELERREEKPFFQYLSSFFGQVTQVVRVYA
jgi:hypothetical protein